MNISLCTIAAPFERPYIKEWCQYHFKIGFDKIYVYLNNWTNDDLGYLKYTDFGGPAQFKIFNGNAKQLPAYADFIQNFSKETDWTLFIDIDEFLVLKKHDSVKDMFANYNKFPALGFNWVFFGDNGHKEVVNEDYSVIRRFTKSQTGVNKHIKTAVNFATFRIYGKNPMFFYPHSINCATYSTDGDTKAGFISPFNENGKRDVAYIAHFAVKTKQEFYFRRGFARADDGQIRTNLEAFFNESNRNEENNEDLINIIK